MIISPEEKQRKEKNMLYSIQTTQHSHKFILYTTNKQQLTYINLFSSSRTLKYNSMNQQMIATATEHNNFPLYLLHSFRKKNVRIYNINKKKETDK